MAAKKSRASKKTSKGASSGKVTIEIDQATLNTLQDAVASLDEAAHALMMASGDPAPRKKSAKKKSRK